MTAPLIPLSLTRTFEPEPRIVNWILFSLMISITLIKSCLLLGKIIKSAGPPIPYVVCFLRDSFIKHNEAVLLLISFITVSIIVMFS